MECCKEWYLQWFSAEMVIFWSSGRLQRSLAILPRRKPLDFRKMSDTAWLIFRVGGSSTKFHSLGEHMNLGVRFSFRNTQMMYCASQAAVGKTISIQLCRWRRTMDRPERNAKEHRCCISHIYKNEFHEQCWPHKTLSLKSVYENS